MLAEKLLDLNIITRRDDFYKRRKQKSPSAGETYPKRSSKHATVSRIAAPLAAYPAGTALQIAASIPFGGASVPDTSIFTHRFGAAPWLRRMRGDRKNLENSVPAVYI